MHCPIQIIFITENNALRMIHQAISSNSFASAPIKPSVPINSYTITRMASGSMMNWILSLPDYAFNMAGDVGTDDRLLWSAAPVGTPVHMLTAYPRVTYRFGWRGQGDRIAVSFVMPIPGGAEAISVAVHAAAWGMLSPSIWKQMVLRYLPLGVVEFPVRE